MPSNFVHSFQLITLQRPAKFQLARCSAPKIQKSGPLKAATDHKNWKSNALQHAKLLFFTGSIWE